MDRIIAQSQHGKKHLVKKNNKIANQMTKLHAAIEQTRRIIRMPLKILLFKQKIVFFFLLFCFNKISYITTLYGRLNVIYVHSRVKKINCLFCFVIIFFSFFAFCEHN